MAFPQTPHDVRTEFQIGGTWTEVTSDVYTRDPITIERGRKDEGTTTDPTKVSFVLNNRLGKYSPRNPLSPYYGLIGRNTPIRISVPGSESYLALPGTAADIASTPDHASLDVAGDIDVRVEATADWYVTGKSQMLIGKWSSTDGQQSWNMRAFNGLLVFNWTTGGGSGTSAFVQGTIPGGLRRAAFRATLDIDNGAGGKTATLYWSTSMSGTWTQFAQGTIAGTSAIFASTTPVEIAPSQPANNPPRLPLEGRVHRAEIRSGIGGTVVASPDFRSQTAGATSFADSAGRTWTVAGAASITNREYRAYAEISEWPSRWDVSGKDVWVPIQAAGVQRRLGQGAKPLASTLRRRVPTATGLMAYWPLEEGATATRAYSPVPGVNSLSVTGMDFASEDSLGGSSALPKLKNPASLRGSIPRATTAGWQIEMVYKLPTMPATQTEILRVAVTGSACRTAVVYASTAGIRVEALDEDGASLAFFLYSNATALADFVGTWNRLQIFTSDNGGGQTRLVAAWRDITDGGGKWASSTVYTGTMGYAAGVSGVWGANTEGMAIGHLGAIALPGSGTTAGSVIYENADEGYDGETAIDRLNRLANEEAAIVDLSWIDGDTTRASELVGPQRPEPLLDLLESCAAVDGGLLYEPTTRLGLVYRDRTSLENQTVALALNYAADGEVGPPLEPTEDDQRLRNDVTVTRQGGTSGRAVLEEGPLSVQAPPNGVGVYEESVTLDLHSDAQPAPHAGWRMHLGTVDEARYPTVHVMLHAAPQLIPAVLAMELGDRLTISNPPAWLPPDPIDQMALGYTEVLDQYTWDIYLNCVPASPYTVGVLDSATLGRADTDGSVLAAAVSSSATAMTVLATDGPSWTRDPADVPFDVRMGGERVTVTAITGAAQDDFSAAQTDAWGPADVGGTWSLGGGTVPGDYDVASGRGLHLLGTVNTSRRSFLTQTIADTDTQVDIQSSALATGAAITGSIGTRYIDSDNLYLARIAFNTDQTMTLTIRKRVAAAETQLASFTPQLTHAASTDVRLRFRVFGTLLQAKVWDPTRAEPGFWQLEVTDSSLTTSALIGLRSILVTGNTNVSPLVRYDNFILLNPTRWTVTRSVNGVSKAQAAGEDVRLFQPTIIAL
ncbi:hypothetical protein [Streptomyces sp. NPDC127084]|uniref:hypothetical protein n=1 Tax=Streptomyces sp. NPDC127084 TaxID=3347133 RepID=UPI0036630E6C